MRLAAKEPAKPSREQEEFNKEHLEKILTLYRDGRRKEALQQVDRSLLSAKARFGDYDNFYGKLWGEAQIRSGNADEEWGLDVFLRLLRANHVNSPRKEPNYLIYDNISEKLRAMGRVMEARELAASEAISLATFARLDTANRSYKDQGPLFSFLPDARKRQFPMRKNDIDPEAAEGPIYYPRMYAVNEIATSALDVGDWVKAAELYRWFADYAVIYCTYRIPRRDEVSQIALTSYGKLAAICEWHGYPAEADLIYGEFIDWVGRKGHPAKKGVPASAVLSQLVLRIKLGTLPENAIEIAENAAETVEGHIHFDRMEKFAARVKVARIYHATGNRKRAWELIADLDAKADSDVNPHYQMVLLYPKIDFALEEGGTHPELEAWLTRLLNFERSMGNKFNELQLYEKYAEFLRLNGRSAESVEIMTEAVRLSVAMNVPKRTEKNRAILREIINSIKVPTEEESRRVDVQPMSSRSTVVPGSVAYGRFFVTNPSTVKKTGSLQMTGAITTDSRIDLHQLQVSLDTAAAVRTIERPVAIEPGASCVVDVSGQGGLDQEETQLSCEWVELGETVSEGIWIYSSSEIATRTAVVDAHALRISPFYLVPIRHMIQRKGDATESTNVDYRISASAPMRIEVYDSTGTTLISVDANGDGDFEDKGDLIYQDINGNGHPDLTMGEGETLVSLTMYVEPGQIAPEDNDDAREISISILEDGEWHLDAVDLIK